MVIGVLSLLYALGGLLCQTGMGAMTLFSDALIQMQGGNMESPLAFKIVYGVLATVGLCLGMYMVVASIALLRRRRSGVTMLRHWAVMRLVLILIGCLATLATIRTHIGFAKANIEAQNARFIEAEMSDRVQPVPTDEAMHRQVMMQTGIFSGLTAIYPIILGFYLTRRKISDDVATWV